VLQTCPFLKIPTCAIKIADLAIKIADLAVKNTDLLKIADLRH